MFKKTIKFTKFDDTEVQQDFYFHMNKIDLMTYASSGAQERIEKMVRTKDLVGILNEFKTLVALSCGLRSDDGARFDRSPEAQAHLLDSPAYDELLFELMTNDGKAGVEFMRQLMPKPLMEQLMRRVESGEAVDPFANPEKIISGIRETKDVELPQADKRSEWEREGRLPTDSEMLTMGREELLRAVRAINESKSQ